MSINKAKVNGTTSITLPLPVANGSLIVLGVVSTQPVDALNFTSPRWAGSMGMKHANVAGANRAGIYAILATSSGTCTITCTEGNQPWGNLWAIEIPGGSDVADDQDDVYTNANPSVTSITTIGASRVICTAQGGFHNACVFTDGSSAQIFDQINGNDALCMQILNAPAAGVYTPTITMTGEDNNPMISVAFPGTAPLPDGNVLTQVATEVLTGGDANAVMTQLAVEVLMNMGGVEPGGGGDEEPPTEPLYSSCDELTYKAWPT